MRVRDSWKNCRMLQAFRRLFLPGCFPSSWQGVRHPTGLATLGPCWAHAAFLIPRSRVQVSRSHHAAAKGSSVSTAAWLDQELECPPAQHWPPKAKQVRLFEPGAEFAAILLAWRALCNCRAMAFADVPSTCDASLSDSYVHILMPE